MKVKLTTIAMKVTSNGHQNENYYKRHITTKDENYLINTIIRIEKMTSYA